MILDEIKAAAIRRVEKAKEACPPERMKQNALKAAGTAHRAPGTGKFAQALREPGISFICEIKRASPSKGLIAPDFPYVKIAREYYEAGASALSVLTEPDFFRGDNAYLSEIREQVPLPALRKDFTIDEYQLYEAKCIGASAVLLICSLLDTPALARYLEICGSLGLDVLVEAHSGEQIRSALEAGAGIIGVNNRNLRDFTVDFDNAVRLRELVPSTVLYVAESGVRTGEDVRRLAGAGVDAVLIGETLMRAENKKKTLAGLRGVSYDEN